MAKRKRKTKGSVLISTMERKRAEMWKIVPRGIPLKVKCIADASDNDLDLEPTGNNNSPQGNIILKTVSYRLLMA